MRSTERVNDVRLENSIKMKLLGNFKADFLIESS